MAHFRDGNFPQDPFAPQFGSWLSSAVHSVTSTVKNAAGTVVRAGVGTALLPFTATTQAAANVASRLGIPGASRVANVTGVATAVAGSQIPGIGSTIANTAISSTPMARAAVRGRGVMPLAPGSMMPAASRSRSDYPGGVNPFIPSYMPTGKGPGYNPNQVNATNPLTPVQLPSATAQPATPTTVALPSPTPTPPSVPTPYVPPSYTPPDTSAVATAQPAEPTTVAVPTPAAVAPATSGGGGGAILAGAGAGFLVGGPVGALVGGGLAAWLGKKS